MQAVNEEVPKPVHRRGRRMNGESRPEAVE